MYRVVSVGVFPLFLCLFLQTTIWPISTAVFYSFVPNFNSWLAFLCLFCMAIYHCYLSMKYLRNWWHIIYAPAVRGTRTPVTPLGKPDREDQSPATQLQIYCDFLNNIYKFLSFVFIYSFIGSNCVISYSFLSVFLSFYLSFFLFSFFLYFSLSLFL